MTAVIIRFKDIDRKDHGHFAGNNGRCALCEVRSFEEFVAQKEARQREWDEMRRLGLK